jgi:GT2 family glycosyltransferase
MTPALVIVVAYGNPDLLADCLEGLGGHDPVVVVDNAADPATQAVVTHHQRTYVPAPDNPGFAAGVNLGLRSAWDGSRDVLLLNPDARIAPTQIGQLQERLHEAGSRCAAVGPQLRRPDGSPEPASWPMPSPGQVWLDALGLGRFARGDRFVTGAALLLRGDALTELGTLDERYFLYAEETDWQMRALRAGWSVAVDERVEVTHVGGASSSDEQRRARLFHRSGRLFAERWYPGFGAYAMRLGRVVAACRRWLTQPSGRVEQRELLAVSTARSVEDLR